MSQISSETKTESMRVAKATQKPGQTKEQTKLIALGIEKGIAEYKKQQKSKSRDRDKQRKQQLRAKRQDVPEGSDTELAQSEQSSTNTLLPWGLLALSWIGFIAYVFLN